MYNITIKGEGYTNYPNIKELDGIECDDEFTEYFHEKYGNDENEQSLINKGVHNGYMHFKVEGKKLMTITTYLSEEKLTKKELDILAKYTQGQWSDGIGEGFEQNPCKYAKKEYETEDGEFTKEIYISPWFFGQELVILQEKETK